MKHTTLFGVILAFSCQNLIANTISNQENDKQKKTFQFQPIEQCMAVFESGYKTALKINENTNIEKLQKLWLCDNSENKDESQLKVKGDIIYKLLNVSGELNKEEYYHYKREYCSKEDTTENSSSNFNKLVSTLPTMSQEAYRNCQTNIAIATEYAPSLSCTIWSEDQGRRVFIDLLPHTETGAGSIIDLNYTFKDNGIFTSIHNEPLPEKLNAENMHKQSAHIQKSFPLTIQHSRRIMLKNSAPEDKTKTAEIYITGLTEYEKREVECAWSWRAFDDVEAHCPKPPLPPQEEHCKIEQHIENFKSNVYKHRHKHGQDSKDYKTERAKMQAEIDNRRELIKTKHNVVGNFHTSESETYPYPKHSQIHVKMYWNEKICSNKK